MSNQGFAPRHLAFGALLVALVATFGSGAQVTGQEHQGKYVVEASERLSKIVQRGNADGYKLTDNNFSIGGGWLKQSQKDWVPLFTITLDQGREYRMLAAGDNDAKDVDLQIVDTTNNRVVAEDAGTEPTATLNFRPNNTQKYLIRIRLYDSDKNLPCVCLGIVMSK